MKKPSNLKQKLSSIVVLICGLIIFFIYLLDLKQDYYFQATSKKTTASIEQIKKVERHKPYIITLSYLNEYTGNKEQCQLKLDGKFGKKVTERNFKTLDIIYTRQDSCDVYIEEYRVPSTGGLIVHLIIFLIATFGVFVFSKKVFKKNSVE